MKTVTLYTDGACSGNPGPGGWGAILEFNGHEKELSGGEANTTNNRMELTAVIQGLKNYNITAKTGKVAGCRVVAETDDVMVIENGGVIIRTPVANINVYKRDVQGVIVMRIEEGNKVVSIERVENEETEEA